MKKLKGRALRVMKCLHLFGVICWVGGNCASLILLLQLKSHADVAGALARLEIMETLDWNMIVVGALFSVALGVVYGALTPWGFFRQRWLVIKWVLSVAIIVSGSLCFVPLLEKLSAAIKESGIAAWEMAAFQLDITSLFMLLIFQLAAMVLMVALSVFKPCLRRNGKAVC